MKMQNVFLHCLADKAENDELPNWWIDKVSKADLIILMYVVIISKPMI